MTWDSVSSTKLFQTINKVSKNATFLFFLCLMFIIHINGLIFVTESLHFSRLGGKKENNATVVSIKATVLCKSVGASGLTFDQIFNDKYIYIPVSII